MIAIAVTAALVLGYLVGRTRPGPRLLSWAEEATAPGWRTPRFWLGAPVAVAALAWVWLVHPRRTLSNVRSWRAGERLHPAPVYDPAWTDRQDGEQR